MACAAITLELAYSLVYWLKFTVDVLKYVLAMYFHELIVVTRFSKLLISSTKCVFHARSRFVYLVAVGLQKSAS